VSDVGLKRFVGLEVGVFRVEDIVVGDAVSSWEDGLVVQVIIGVIVGFEVGTLRVGVSVGELYISFGICKIVGFSEGECVGELNIGLCGAGALGESIASRSTGG
jgi:hypothetical protein